MCYNVTLIFCITGFCQWVWILSVGLDFGRGSGYDDPHGPDSLLYHVIYTQPWHNVLYMIMLIHANT